MRIAVRGFAEGRRIFEEIFEAETPDLEEIAVRHAERLLPYPKHMIEVEFLDEPNPLERFFRLGTDPSRMVQPIGIQFHAESESEVVPSRWCHALCDDCYARVKPGVTPVRVVADVGRTELCCRCGEATSSGIYYRARPDAFPCKGEHAKEQSV